MVLPLFWLGLAFAGAEYAILKPHPTRANPFPDGKRPGPVPVPVPAPAVAPPATMNVLPGVDLVADLSQAVPGQAGQMVPVTWTFTSGPYAGDAGGGTLPLAWLAPDKSKAAVVWNVDPAYFGGDTSTFKPGAVYAARPMAAPDVPFFAAAFSGPAASGGVTTGIANSSGPL